MWSPIHLGPALALATLTLAGCAAATQGPSPFDEGRPSAEFQPADWSPDEITRSEIDSRGQNDHTAMALVRRLRPAWLRARGQKSFNDERSTYPTVYIDEIRHGGLGALNRIPSSEIQRIEFIGTADATTRWGTGHPSGVINVVTGR